MVVAVLSIYDLRVHVADLITEAGMRAYAEAPKALTGAGAIVDPADPYITPGGRGFQSITVHFTVTLLVNPSPNWEQEVEEMITRSIEVLYDDDTVAWDLSGISLYDSLQLTNNNNRVFKGAQINLAATVAIKEMIQ